MRHSVWNVDRLKAYGFDRSTYDRLACSQCNAVAINGIGVHEKGCPNERHECRGCTVPVPLNVRYCEDCR